MSKTNSTILRGFGKYFLFSIGGAVGLVLLIAVALTARLAIGPISVAFMGPSLRESIGESLYYAYDVKFDDLELRWNDGHGNFGLALVGVRVADYSAQDIASVPEIIFGLSPGAMIDGDTKPAAITVIGPKIRWIKTAGGAIKFDIGAHKPGESGKILEDFLITMASAQEPDEGSKEALPEMRIVDADILIGNEVNNTTLHISDADIAVAPHAEGVRTTFELVVETESEPVRISAEGLFRTKDQRIELALKFEDLALSGLGALLPGQVPESIMSEPFTGTVQLDMDKFFSIDTAVFSVSGDALDLTGRAHIDASLVSLEAQGTMAKSSLLALRDGWPAGLGQDFDAWLAGSANQESSFALALRGSVNRFDQTLDLSGTIGPSETPFTVSGITDSPVIEIPAKL
jgi:hypothetical protein